MIVQDPATKGGIAAVVNGYRGSDLEKEYDVTYVESYRDGSKIGKFTKAVSAYFKFIRLILADKPDLVHVHSSFGPSFYRKIPFIYLASWAGIPVVNHIHGAEFDPFYTNAGERKKKRVRKVYGRCSILIALSDEWKTRLEGIFPSERIRVISNYSIIHEDALADRTLRRSDGKVLFLGELGERKGCHDIPAVASQVCEKFPGAEFILGGEGTPDETERLKREFRDAKVDGVSFPGWVRGDRKDEQLREADVFFLPSYNEGMPMAVLDAMGYGLPVVSTCVGGIPHIVRDGENGWCCKPGDTRAMSECIIKLLGDDELRHTAGMASMNIVKERYSLKYHLEQLCAVYSEVLGEKSGEIH